MKEQGDRKSGSECVLGVYEMEIAKWFSDYCKLLYIWVEMKLYVNNNNNARLCQSFGIMALGGVYSNANSSREVASVDSPEMGIWLYK